ncbi:MAG: class I tRNA ligase family protein [Candidatus Paceibacterota bacterium]
MKEEEILKFWQENKIFEKSVNKPAPNGDFVFYDGPPFATGTPHYGHIVASAIKDAVPRYWTMRGYRVERKWGWDCHGLPIENIAEKELGIKRKKEIEEMGVGKFNEFCRSKVLEYVEEWKKVIARLGRWADLEDSYKTMDLPFMESVWWVFKQLWEKGLIYEGYRSMHICTRCETTLSQQEVAEGYKDIKDLSATVKFELADEPGTFVLAWTTTPWTLIGNVALAVGEKIEYVKVKVEKDFYILAKERVAEILKDKEYEIVSKLKGKDLIGKKYKSLFPYYINSGEIYGADFVTTDEGTGIVHIAPAFGEDDFKLMEKYKLPFIQHVGMDGIIKPEAKDFAGKSITPRAKNKPEEIREIDLEIVKFLGDKIFDWEKPNHSYPHCWRCDTPLINYATSSWFVNITKIKDKALKLAKKINWSPAHIKEGRFGKWLEGARDWSISRQRYWASVIPVWKCDKCKEVKVVGSVDEIREQVGSPNKLFLVRHGEAESNVKNILNSDLNQNHYALTKNGRERVEKLAKELKNEKIDLIFSSPFLRTKQTAEIIAEKTGAEVIIDERLHEIKLGEFEGKTEEDIWWQFPTRESRAEKAGFGVESGQEIRKRLENFLAEINEKYKNKNIVVVSHGDPIQIFYGLARGISLLESFKGWYPEKGYAKIVYSKPIDLHKHVVDKVVLNCLKCDGKMHRVPDVLDTWFDSGSMPYAQVHYPFENKEKFEENFPAQFIGEGVDQTRAWFYYLHAIATAIKGSRAFSNVIVNGTVLAEDGKKMSKRLQNYPDPMEVINKYGADALRFYLLSSPVVKAENLSFSEKGVDEAHKKVILRLKNVLAFYKMYVNKPSAISFQLSENILDKWILARLNVLTGEITKAMDKYELNEAVRPIGDFVDDLSNWYVRRSRDRFKNDGEDKNNAVATLHHVLIELSKLIAPFMPFVAEEIYLELKGEKAKSHSMNAIARSREAGFRESVHLESWPAFAKVSAGQAQLINDMQEVRKVVSVGLELRLKEGIKVKQPLSSVTTPEKLKPYASLIKDELNVKEVVVGKDVSLDTKITPELKNEGVVRELIRNIQDLRKKAGMVPQDKIIELKIETSSKEEELANLYMDNIKKGTGSISIKFDKVKGEEIKIDELKFKIEIKK